MRVILPFGELTERFEESPTGKRCFKSEVDALPATPINLAKHKPARPDGRSCRGERRNALRDQICVDEVAAVGIARKKRLGEGRLARSVRPRNDIDVGIHEGMWYRRTIGSRR